MRAPLTLYGTSACHLCDQAKGILEEAGLAFVWVDIAADAALLERYGVRIPVVRHPAGGRELDWPFDRSSLVAFIQTLEV